MRLAEVLRDAGRGVVADVSGTLDESVGNLNIVGIALSSDGVEPGFAFAALAGHHRHGAEFIDEACRRGAVAVITDAEGQLIIARSAQSDIPIVVYEQPRPLVAHIAAFLAGFPHAVADDGRGNRHKRQDQRLRPARRSSRRRR